MKTPGPKLSIMVQPRDGGFMELGTGAFGGYQVVPESISFTGDITEYGCAEANWIMRCDPKYALPYLEHFTPVVISDGAQDVWSGRIIATPTTFGDEKVVHCQAQGWGQHTKDDPIDKMWVVQDLTLFKPTVGSVAADLSKYSVSGNLEVGSGTISFAFANNDYWKGSRIINSVTFDAGPNNLVKRALVDYASSAGYGASVYFDVYTHDTPCIGSDLVSGNFTALYSHNSFNTASNVGGTSATARRYLSIFLYYSAADSAVGAVIATKVFNVRLFTSTRDESGNASTLLASNVIKDTLMAACPLISSDQSQITTTSFNIPEFYTDGYQYPDEIIDRVNAYHGYQFKLTPDPVPVAIYRPQPSDPVWVVGSRDNYKFENPSEHDGRNVYSRVISEYEDAAGTRNYANTVTPSSGQIQLPSSVAFTNPSFTTNTTGWTAINGSISRDTGVFNTTPASLKLTSSVTLGSFYNSSQLTGLVVGRKYRLTFFCRLQSASSGFRPAIQAQSYTTGAISKIEIISPILTQSFQAYTFDFVANDTSMFLLMWHTVLDPLTVNPQVGQTGAGDNSYWDDFSISELAGNVVERRGFTRTALKPMSSKSTLASARQISQLELDASQFPPLKGTLTVQGRLRRKGSHESIPVCRIPSCVGDAILIENLTDPNTGALGRQGIIQRMTYDRDTDTLQMEIDNPSDFIDAVRARIGAVTTR